MNASLEYILNINVVLILVSIAYSYLFKNALNPKQKRGFLIGGILFAVISPLFSLPLALKESVNTKMDLPNWLINGEASTKMVQQSTGLNLEEILIVIMGTGLIYFLTRFTLGLIRIRQIMSKSTYQLKGNFYQIPNSSDAFSFFNLIFVGDQFSEKERAIIILHERAHSKGMHSLDCILLQLMKAAFWYNPIIYKLNAQLTEAHEFEADAESSNQENQITYIELLLQQQFGAGEISFIHSFNQHHLKNRIMEIQAKRKNNKTLQILLITGLFFGTIFSVQAYSKAIIANHQIQDTKKQDLDVVAKFPGGIDALIKFLGETVKYPESAKKDGIEETIFIQFKVDENGKVSDFNVLKGKNEALKEASINALSQMPKWEPAQKDDKNVASKMTIPVKFALTDDKKGKKEK